MRLKKPSIDPSIKRLLTYLLPYRWRIVLAIFFMLLAGAASSLIAMLLGKLTDIGFYNQEGWIVIAAPVGLIFISVLHGGSMFMSNYLLGMVSQSVLMTLRQQIFHQMLRWPAENYQKQPAGKMSSKFVFEANVMLAKATKSCITFVRDSCQVLALSAILLWHNWMLALVSFVFGPLIIILLRYIATKLKANMALSQQSFGAIMVRVKEAHQAQRLIKISGSFNMERHRFEEINEGVRDQLIRMTKIRALGAPLTQLICMSCVAFVLALAMYQANIGVLTLGEFVTFLAALLLLTPPLRNLASVNAGFVTMSMAAKSIFGILDANIEPDEGTYTFELCKGDVVFEKVSLRYPKTKHDAVHDFSMHVKSGECIALIGLSGSGKSSVINMIPRFWNPTRGRILIDGIDTQTMRLASLRDQIAVVSQDVILFDDTIRNNLIYGTKNASTPEIMRAVEDAALTEFINSLPKGLDTPVGEAGNLLSGGQKQRISIARALLKNAPILILDEATSALDSETEHQIKEAMVRLMKGRTCITIAHRFSAIEHADRIIVMQGGRVVEEGTRAELLAKNGHYARLCRLQDGKQKTKEIVR